MLYMQSLWSELSTYLLKHYFDPQLPYFYHLSNYMDGAEAVVIVAAVLFGVLTAGTLYVYQRRVIGAIPRAVAVSGAIDEKTAVSLSDLGVKLGWIGRFALRGRASTLRRYIRFVGAEELTYESFGKGAKAARRADLLLDLDKTPCYIPTEKLEECKKRFALEKSGGWGTVAWFWVGGVVLFFVVCRFLPEILALVDRIVGAFA